MIGILYYVNLYNMLCAILHCIVLHNMLFNVDSKGETWVMEHVAVRIYDEKDVHILRYTLERCSYFLRTG